MAQLFLGNPLLDGLNAEQCLAVSEIQGPLLVIAAPGSGKTLVLTRRIAYLVHQGVAPEQILAVTFTRKAAGEMAQRLQALLRDKHLVGRITIATYNSLGGKLLEGKYERLGFTAKPHLLLETSQRALFDVLRRDVHAEEVRRDELAQYISSAKSRMLGPEDVKTICADEAEVKMARLFRAYQGRLLRQNLYDFDDQILLPIRLMQSDPAARAEIQARWSHVMVDEFQDTNKAQYALTRLLAAPHDNLFAVGDDAQGIYGFRAADLDNLLSFERDYPKGQRVIMETNYRSTPPIVELANNLIRFNSRQISKTIRASARVGEPVLLTQMHDSFEEAQLVCKRIGELAAAGIPLDAVAVLYRTHAQSGLLVEAL
ncbi:MAG: UvrD-helicase domain-containing protein, partial [Cyanobacteria bacterium REEB65]|nr:UvrD-helicase domain-containing protein [Cyanobacteria bacterium REEB65]